MACSDGPHHAGDGTVAEATRRDHGEESWQCRQNVVVTATTVGNRSLVFEAMGYGALDAVNTPTLSRTGNMAGAEPLLQKLRTVARLVRPARTEPAKTSNAHAPGRQSARHAGRTPTRGCQSLPSGRPLEARRRWPRWCRICLRTFRVRFLLLSMWIINLPRRLLTGCSITPLCRCGSLETAIRSRRAASGWRLRRIIWSMTGMVCCGTRRIRARRRTVLRLMLCSTRWRSHAIARFALACC